ncbi:hypothetical protein PVAP13_1NG203538, partial [Panicum virgatum]
EESSVAVGFAGDLADSEFRRRRHHPPRSPVPVSLSACSATCSLLTSGSSRTPTPHTSQAYLQLVYWSENPGQDTIGTPAATPSHVEFHPLCVRKQPTAGWRSTCSCGHHAVTWHLPAAAAVNSGGNTPGPPPPPRTRLSLMHHRIRWPLAARPHANSASCSGVSTVWLPKLT